MPTMTKVHPPVTGESFDITSLTRLAEHPSLAPLFARRVGLNQRHATLAHAVQGLRQQLGGLPLDGGSFATATRRSRSSWSNRPRPSRVSICMIPIGLWS